MDTRGGQTFEPGDDNPLGDPDTAAIQQVGQPLPPAAPTAPLGPDGTPLYGGGPPAAPGVPPGQPQVVPPYPGTPAPPVQPGAPTDQAGMANQFGAPAQPPVAAGQPGAMNQFGTPAAAPPPAALTQPAALAQPAEVNQFGTPVQQGGGVNQFGTPAPPLAPGQPGATTPFGTPAPMTPGAPHPGQHPPGMPYRPPATSLYAERSMYGGIAAIVILLIYLFGPGLGIVSLIMAVGGAATAIYAVTQGHLGLRDVQRGRGGKPQAVAGLVMGYLVLLGYLVVVVLFVVFVLLVTSAINSATGDDFFFDWEDPPAAVADAPIVEATSLASGDCILYPQTSSAGYAFQEVNCTQEHAGQVVYVSVGESAYPGSTASGEWDDCFEAFDAFVGESYWTSIYEYYLAYPSQDAWADGERWAVCFIEYPSYSTQAAQSSGR